MFENCKSKRTDTDYWNANFLSRAYLRCLYAIMGALVSGCLADAIGLDITIQYIIAGVIGVVILLFRIILPNGFTDIINNSYGSLTKKVQDAQRELSDGDTSGVPKSLQKIMSYPTKEEIKQMRIETDKQKAAFEAELKRRKKAKQSRKRK